MFIQDFNKLKELLLKTKPINYNGEELKTKNIVSRSITINVNENVPVMCSGDVKDYVNLALNELDYILSTDQHLFIAGGMLSEKNKLTKYVVNDEDYITFSKDLTGEYLENINKEDYVVTVGYHNGQHYRMVMRTSPLTFYDLNVPLAKDYISKLANNLRYDDNYKKINNEDEKKQYLSNIEMKAREAFIDPLTEIVHCLNKGFNTPMVISLYDISTKTLPGSLKGTMAFIGRSECIYNITQVEFINLDDVLHLNFNMLEMDLNNNLTHDILIMSALLIGVSNISKKKVGTVTANISRVYLKEEITHLNDQLNFIQLEINGNLTDVSEINSQCFSYEIK